MAQADRAESKAVVGQLIVAPTQFQRSVPLVGAARGHVGRQVYIHVRLRNDSEFRPANVGVYVVAMLGRANPRLDWAVVEPLHRRAVGLVGKLEIAGGQPHQAIALWIDEKLRGAASLGREETGWR